MISAAVDREVGRAEEIAHVEPVEAEGGHLPSKSGGVSLRAT
jgi:hypothetical protein